MPAPHQPSFDRSGSGEPVVLLHGVGSRRQVFAPVSGLLATAHDVIAVDLPGFGATPDAVRTSPGIEGYADVVERLLDSLGLADAHLVGSSMGGGIALELGARGRARSVTAFSPIGFWGGPGLVWVRAAVTGTRALCRVARPVLPALVRSAPARGALFGLFYGRPRQLAGEVGLADVDGLLGSTGVAHALEAFGRWRPTDAPALRRVPVTIAWGTRDVLLTYSTQARRARQLLPWARHTDLPACGHLPFADDPAACLAAVTATIGAASRS